MGFMNQRNSHLLFVTLLTLVGIFLHFYNLNWGAPWYFHPDERNIASAVSQLQFPSQMNPHFFAYGSLPIYTIFFTGLLTHFFVQPQIRFDEAIIISRAYSAFFATLLIPMLYFLGKRLKDETTGLFTAVLGTFSVGMIQFSHYGTFELWLTFFSVCLFWACLQLLNHGKFLFLLLAALVFGVLVAIKVSSLALLPLPILAIAWQHRTKNQTTPARMTSFWGRTKTGLQNLSIILGKYLFFVFIAILVYVPTNPFVLLVPKDFVSSMQYESSVGLGTLPVFYTGGFFDTIPVVYQFLHVYPFLLNPLITILFVLSFFSLSYHAIKTRKSSYILLTTFYLILFLSQAVLFVKWTRYLMPTLPFIFLLVALSLTHLLQRYKTMITTTVNLLVLLTAVFAISYFKTVYLNPDSRLAALAFAKANMPPNAYILSEPYDLGITPFQGSFPGIEWFNFYELDNHSLDATEGSLRQYLAKDNYIILPSQRVLQTRMQNAQQFSKAHLFYQQLFNGALGYKKIYETPCDIFCQITYLGDPIYWWEQTASVFDHPTVFIFKKI